MTSPAAQFDVAVVGASVAGCTAARPFGTIERLGLAPLLVERGALRTQAELWTPYGGWFALPDEMPDGWGVTPARSIRSCAR